MCAVDKETAMPSHLSDIGFPLETDEDFYKAFESTAENGEAVTTPAGTYLRWTVGGGPELWAQIDPDDNAVGLNPHFAGEARMRVAVVARVERIPGNPMDGSFYAWAEPYEVMREQWDDTGEDEERAVSDRYEGEYPFIFDVPDRGFYDTLELPLIVPVQLSAFSHGLRAFASDAEFDEAQPPDLRLAPESFIPTGLFVPEDEELADVEFEGEAFEDEETEDETPAEAGEEEDDLKVLDDPRAEAVISGHVLDTQIRVNRATGQPYLWARVKTLGGEIDIVADPETVQGDVTVGGVVQGEFWLSGRLCIGDDDTVQ
jgi:hypothetical protein